MISLATILGSAALGHMVPLPPCAQRRASLTIRATFSLWLLGAAWVEASGPPGLVFAWGDNSNGQTAVPAGLRDVVAIACGSLHSLALKVDGTVAAWGNNGAGQCSVPPTLSNVVAIAGGGSHSLALREDGTIAAWGSSPAATVPPGLGNVIAIAGGGSHSLAVKADGAVAAWGYNGAGQTSVPAGLSNVVAVAGGGSHSLALKANGTVIAWGSTPATNVPPDLSNVVAIAAGPQHSVALKRDGLTAVWGSPDVALPWLVTNVAAITAGGDQTVALTSNGQVRISLVYVNGPKTPMFVPAWMTNVTAIAGGAYHALSIIPAPVIRPQPPATVSLAYGSSTNLSVSVVSASLFTCQWSFNGLPISEATGTNLAISSFDVTKAGTYSVTASNQCGYTATAVTVVRLQNSAVVLVDGADVGGGTVVRVYSAQVTMSSSFGPAAAIYYTLDGSTPDYTGIPYRGPFTLLRSGTIRAIAYNQAYTAWAEAAPIWIQIWPAHCLTANTAGGGSISISPAPDAVGSHYLTNALVTLTATPSNGWSFLHWLGDAAGADPTIALAMIRDRAAQAVFGTTITTNILGSGSIQLSPLVPLYPFGTTVRLAALPQAGNYFGNWAGAASGTNTPTTLVVKGATPIVTATFALLPPGQYALSTGTDGKGRVTAIPYANRYTNGQIVSLTAAPDLGHAFLGWSGDAIGTANPLRMTMDASKVIIARFTKRPTLSVAGNLGGMTPSGFRLFLTGEYGVAYQILGSTNLSDWLPLGVVTNQFGTVQFTDPTATNSPKGFYRALQE